VKVQHKIRQNAYRRRSISFFIKSHGNKYVTKYKKRRHIDNIVQEYAKQGKRAGVSWREVKFYMGVRSSSESEVLCSNSFSPYFMSSDSNGDLTPVLASGMCPLWFSRIHS